MSGLYFWVGVSIVLFCFCMFLAHACEREMKARENAEAALAEQKLAVSGLLNWAVIRLGSSHPEIDPICRAIEKAVHTGRPLEAERLGHELDQIKHGRVRR